MVELNQRPGPVMGEAASEIRWARVLIEYLAAVGPGEPVFYPFKRILMWGRLPLS